MRLLACFCVLVGVVPVALAAVPRTVSAPAPVGALAMDGRVVAFVSGGSADDDCDRVRIWNLTTRAVTVLGRRTFCESTSTGTGIASLAVAGNRVLWLHYAGGNIREWSLFTATTTQRTPRQLAFEPRDVDEPSPLVIGPGDASRLGDILPYGVDRTVIALRTSGARRFSWRAPARITALAALDGELAVASEGGAVTILDALGRVIGSETFDADVDVVRLTGSGVLVQHGRVLELRGSGTPRTWLLPARAVLEDATADAAFYVSGGRIRELRLASTNRQRELGPGSHVQAEVASATIASGRRISVRPLAP